MQRRNRLRRRIVCGLAWTLAAAASGAAQAQQGPDKIIAWVNGDNITQTEFYDRLQRVRATDFLLSQNPPTLRGDFAGPLVLNSLIAERLILQWATKTRQMPTDAEVNAEVEAQKRAPAVAEALKTGLLTEDALRRTIQVELARFNIATTAASISPQEVQAYYKAHLASYSTPERWGLAGIRTSRADVVPKIQAGLKAGKPFETLVQTYSDDPKTKAQNGQMGMLNANSPQLPAAIRDAVRPLQVGQVTPPIKLTFDQVSGKPVTLYWFIRLTSREPGSVRPFDEVKTQVQRQALLERAGGYEVGDKKILTFRQQSDIKIYLPAYQNLANTPKKP
jgi:parvulin-like peptidyl-prolyl isomerase